MIVWTELKIEDEEADFQESEHSMELPIEGSPFGTFPIDSFHPLKVLNCYRVATDFDITDLHIEYLTQIHGIESIVPFSRYQIYIAIGELFDVSYVKDKAESVLTNTNTSVLVIDTIKDKKTRLKIESMRKELSELYEYWAFLIYPNGEIEKVYSDNMEDFSERFSKLEERRSKVNGRIIKANR